MNYIILPPSPEEIAEHNREESLYWKKFWKDFETKIETWLKSEFERVGISSWTEKEWNENSAKIDVDLKVRKVEEPNHLKQGPLKKGEYVGLEFYWVYPKSDACLPNEGKNIACLGCPHFGGFADKEETMIRCNVEHLSSMDKVKREGVLVRKGASKDDSQ